MIKDLQTVLVGHFASDRIAGLLGFKSKFVWKTKPADETGLLDEASVELDKHLAMHPALRANRVTGG